MTRFAFLLLLLTPLSSVTSEVAYGQGFMARGDSLRGAGELRGAIDAYLLAWKADESADGIAYALASTYALQPQAADSAFHFLDIALESTESMEPLYDPDLYFLVNDERWPGVEDRLLGLLESRLGGSFDRSYAQTLLAARMNEWAYRYHIMLLYRLSGGESPVLSALANAMQEHHAQNEKVILSMIDQEGWPRLSVVGAEAAYAAGNIVNHADLETRLKYLPLLEDACNEGEADWSRYAHILDRTELESGRPQIYGTQMELDEESGRYVPQNLVDPEHVDARRAEKGMEPIQDQLDRFNASMQRDFGAGGSG